MTTRSGGRSWDGIRRHDLHRLYVVDDGSTSDAQIQDLDILPNGSLEMSGVVINSISTDGTMASNSDSILVTQKSIRTYVATAVAAPGYVVGPASATDNAITRYDGTTGKLLQDSSASVDDSGNITANNIKHTEASGILLVGTAPATITGVNNCIMTGRTGDVPNITTGTANTFFGSALAAGLPAAASRNTFFGSNIADNFTAGVFNDNLCMGDGVMQGGGSPSSIIQNIAIGPGALNASNSSAVQRNIVIGFEAGNLLDGSTLQDNVIIGHRAADAVTDIGTSVIIGASAVGSSTSSAADKCVVIGYSAAPSLDGDDNTIIGSDTCPTLSSAIDCTIIGHNAGIGLTTGSANILIGKAITLNATRANCIVIGNSNTDPGADGAILLGTSGTHTTCTVAGNLTADNFVNTTDRILIAGFNTATKPAVTGLGNTLVCADQTDMQNLTTGETNTVFGSGIGQNLPAAMASNTMVGANIADNITPTNFSNNVCMGKGILQGTGTPTSVLSNVILGSGAANAANDNNISYTVIIGASAGALLDGATVASNVIIGSNACDAITDLGTSVVIGAGAVGTSTASSTNDAVIIGYNTAPAMTGDNCIVVGAGSAPAITSADNCIMIGHDTGVGLATGGSNILLGNDITCDAARANNIVIGNSNADSGADARVVIGTAGTHTSTVLSSLTSAGFVKTDANGLLSVDGNSYLQAVSSTDNAIARFDGTGGLLQDSGATLDDSGNIKANNFDTTTTSGVILVGEAPAATGINSVMILGAANDLQNVTTGAATVAVGSLIGPNLPDDGTNTLMGSNLMPNMNPTQFQWNVVMGSNCMVGNGTSGSVISNVVIGNGAMNGAIEDTLTRNVVIGSSAGKTLNAANVADNVIIGANTADTITDLLRSVVIGSAALGTSVGSSGVDCVVIGFGAAPSMDSARNTIIGADSAPALTTGTAIMLGHGTGIGLATGNGNILIGDSITCNAARANNIVIGSSNADSGADGRVVIGTAGTHTSTVLSSLTSAGFVTTDANGLLSVDTNTYMVAQSSTDNAITRFNGTSGAVQDSGILIDDTDELRIPEKASASSNSAGVGGLWVQNTSPCALMFTDDTGADTYITNHAHGQMYARSTVQTLSIPSVGEYVLLHHSSSASSQLLDVTHTQGAGTTSVTGVTSSTGALFATGSAHGLSVGDMVSLANFTSYAGVFQVDSVPTTTSFRVSNAGGVLAYVADETGEVTGGDYLTVNRTGTYVVHISLSIQRTSGAAAEYHMQAYVDYTREDESHMVRHLSNNAYGVTGTNWLASITAGERLTVSVEQPSGTPIDVDIKDFNVNLHQYD